MGVRAFRAVPRRSTRSGGPDRDRGPSRLVPRAQAHVYLTSARRRRQARGRTASHHSTMRFRQVPFAVVLAVGALLVAPRAAAAQDYVVIVNASNSATTLPKTEIAALFLKQVTSWPDGSPVVVVDQPERSSTRNAFSRAGFGRPSRAIASYWQQQVFSGKDVPPTQRASDAEVVAFVKANPDAIGYVSRTSPLGPSVRTLKVIAR